MTAAAAKARNARHAWKARKASKPPMTPPMTTKAPKARTPPMTTKAPKARKPPMTTKAPKPPMTTKAPKARKPPMLTKAPKARKPPMPTKAPKAAKPAKQPAAAGIAASYFALAEQLTRNVSRVAAWTGTFRFPKGGAAAWRRRKSRWDDADVGSALDRLARDVTSGERFFDVRVHGEDVAVTAWEWREDHESLERSWTNALEVAAVVGAKGVLTKVARFGHGDCTWERFKLGNKKLAIDDGDADFDSPRFQAVLADAGPPFRAWLDAHPDAQLRFERSGKYGYIDRTGAERVVPTLDRADEFSDGIASIQLGHHSRLLTRAGKLLPGEYFLTDYYLRGRAPVAVEQDRYGYVDGKGVLRIPAQFTRADPFRGPLAIVETAGHVRRWLTPAGELVGDPIEYTHAFTEDLAWIYSYAAKRYRCIDATGTPAFDAQFHATASFAGGLSAVVLDEGGKWGYCDRAGHVVIEPRFDEAHPFSEGRAAVKLGKKCRLIDERGAVLGDSFDGTNAVMHGGRLAVRIKGRYGFVDRDGAIVVSPKFADAHGYFEDRAYVQHQDRWGHIDLDGRYTVRPELAWTNRYRDGLAPAQLRGLYGFIDLAGAWVIPPRYAATQPHFTDGLAWVRLP